MGEMGVYFVAAPAMMLAAIEENFMLSFVGVDWDQKEDIW